jgi:hypothetical protein
VDIHRVIVARLNVKDVVDVDDSWLNVEGPNLDADRIIVTSKPRLADILIP